MLKNNIKILHIISSSEIGGAEIAFLTMLKIGINNGFECAVVCQPNGPLYQEVIKICPNVYTLPLFDNFDIYSLIKLYIIIKKFNPAFCHLHMNRATLLGAIASKLAKVKSLASIQGEVKPIYAYFPDYLTFCSHSVAQFARSKSKSISTKQSFYLYNCIDCEKLLNNSLNFKKENLINEFNLPKNSFIVCQISRIHPNKGHIFLLDAIAKNINRIPNLYCLIVGGNLQNEKKLISDLKEEAIKRNIQNNIIFTGFQENTSKFLNSCDIFVLPSLNEGIPITIMEALLFQLPVVTFNVGGISEFINLFPDQYKSTKNFIELVNIKDTETLSNKIYEIYLNYQEYKKSAELASQYIKLRFDISYFQNDILAIYKHILRQIEYEI